MLLEESERKGTHGKPDEISKYTTVAGNRITENSRYEYDYRYIRISIWDKFGRLMDSYVVYVEKGNDYGNDVNNNALNQYGVIYTTSRDYAYNHCMSVLKRKMTDLRSKANKLHESIYTL